MRARSVEVPGYVQLGRWAELARSGDMMSAGHLYNWLQPRLYAVALSVLGNTEDARDVVQDAFVLGFGRLHELRDPTFVSAWFRRIVQHLCYRRSRRAHPVVLLPQVKDDASDVLTELMDEEDGIALVAAMDRLPEKLRITLLLRFFTADNDYHVLAERLGIPIGTVRSRLNDAKDRMRATWHTASKAVTVPASTEAWTHFYEGLFSSLHTDPSARERMIDHLIPDLHLIFTSKREHRGRDYMDRMMEDDLRYGSLYRPTRVVTSGNISVIDGESVNSKEYPDRCAPRSTFVLVREGERAVRLHIYDSARPEATA